MVETKLRIDTGVIPSATMSFLVKDWHGPILPVGTIYMVSPGKIIDLIHTRVAEYSVEPDDDYLEVIYIDLNIDGLHITSVDSNFENILGELLKIGWSQFE
jgi:hypothetical protein